MNDELVCAGCGMAATPDRFDVGCNENGVLVYVCPMCGYDMGPDLTFYVEAS